jgi:hypothetical protein
MNHEMFMVDAEKSVFVGGHVNINDQILSWPSSGTIIVKIFKS